MTTPSQTKKPGFLKKRWVRVIISLVILVAIGLILLPIGVKIYLVDWLEKNGADTAQIESIRYNPFTTRFTVKGVDVSKGGQSLIKNSSMVLDIGLPSIFNRDVRVEQTEHIDLSVDLEQFSDGSWRIGSFVTSKSSEEEKQVSVEEASAQWNFLADHLLLTNCTITLKTPELDYKLLIKHAELKRFTTHGDRAANLVLDGELNGQPVRFDLKGLQVSPALQIVGQVYVSGFDLGSLGDLLIETLPTFAGTAGIDGKVQFKMQKEGGMSVDYDGKITLANPDIGQPAFNTSAGYLNWDGIVHYSDTQNSGMIIKTDGLLSGDTYRLELPGSGFTTTEAVVELTGKTEVLIDDNVSVTHDGALLVEEIELNVSHQDIAEKKLNWQGRVQYDSKPDQKGLFVKTDGTLEFGPFSFATDDPAGNIGAGLSGLTWQGAVGVGEKQDTSLFIEVTGDLSGEGLQAHLAEQKMTFLQERLEFQTNSRVGFGSKLEVEGEASLDLNNFKLLAEDNSEPLVFIDTFSMPELVATSDKKITVKELVSSNLITNLDGDMPLRIEVAQVQVKNMLVDQLATINTETLIVESTNVISVLNSKKLAELEQLEVKNVLFDEQKKILVAGIELNKFQSLEKKADSGEPALAIAHGILSNLSWDSEKGLAGDQLKLENLQTNIVRDAEGELELNKQLRAMQIPKAEDQSISDPETADKLVTEPGEQAIDEETSKMVLKLKELLFTGENDIVFEDYSLAVPYITDLVITELQAKNIDSSNPENAINVLLVGELEERAPLELSGTVSPFGETIALDLDLSLKNYPLTSLSSYTVQSVGTALSGGQLKIISEIELAREEIDIENEVVLRKLETETISPELAAELNNQLPIPLDAALSLLRDSKDDISLSIPLAGPLDDLNVGISDVLITALSKAIIPAASGYLMYALGPYGALAYVGAKVGEKMLEVRLPPLEFVPQMTDLTDEHRDYMERIGTLLKDRPLMDLQICPRVPAWEFLTEEQKTAVTTEEYSEPVDDEERFLELGQRRGEAVQVYLVEQYGIEETRLLICDPVIELEKDSIPLLLLQI